MNYSHKKVLRTITLLGFIFSLQVALTIYSNSSFLEQLIDSNYIGLFYAGGALITLIGIYITPRIITRLGTRNTLSLYALLTIISLLVLILVQNTIVLLAALGLYLVLGTLLYLTLDIIIEHFSKQSAVGKIRGYYLALVNLAYVIAPLFTGFILGRFGFPVLFAFSAILILILFFAGFRIPNVSPSTAEKPIISMIRQVVQSKQLLAIFISNFTLQFFYAWMVVYVPHYLHTIIGIPWGRLGLMFSISLLAFVLLQIPIGYSVDSWISEKKMLFIGHSIMGISTIIFGFFSGNTSFWVLVVLFFITRIGASIIEISSDSYFFKSIDANHTHTIGLFRTMYPIAYIIAPLLASLLFMTGISYQTFFTILGILSIIGGLPLLLIKKTNTGY